MGPTSIPSSILHVLSYTTCKGTMFVIPYKAITVWIDHVMCRRTCDSFFTTQMMIQLESIVLTENNTFDVYAATT